MSYKGGYRYIMKLDESLFESVELNEDMNSTEKFINYVRDNFDVSSEYIRLLYNLIPYCVDKHGFEETKEMLKETVADSIGMDEDEVESEFVVDEEEYDESLQESFDEEDVYFKLLHFIDDLGYNSDVAKEFYQLDDVMSSLKSLLNRVDDYNKKECLDEAVNEDDAWSYEEIEKILKDHTNGWKRESGVARTYYKTEKEHIMKALKDHYKTVEPSDGRGSDGEEMSWVIAYSDPIKEGEQE